jgi:hypothetical protein
MRLLRPRFTLRLIMIVVAVAAVFLSGGIGAVKLVRRAKHFRQLASNHANLEKGFLALMRSQEQIVALSRERRDTAAANLRLLKKFPNVSSHSREGDDLGLQQLMSQIEDLLKKEAAEDVAPSIEWIEVFRALTAYHALLRQEYQRAASHPWETIPPDPPHPLLAPTLTAPPVRKEPIPQSPGNRRSEPQPFFTVTPPRGTAGSPITTVSCRSIAWWRPSRPS